MKNKSEFLWEKNNGDDAYGGEHLDFPNLEIAIYKLTPAPKYHGGTGGKSWYEWHIYKLHNLVATTLDGGEATSLRQAKSIVENHHLFLPPNSINLIKELSNEI